jgi:hypothetical protein
VKETVSLVTNLGFDVKGETDEEELLQAESECDGTVEQEQQMPASAKNKFKNKIFRGTRPRYQPETASAVLMKYLVENDHKRQAEPPVDPIDAFFKSIAATLKTFSPYHQNICKSRIFEIVSEVEMTDVLLENKSLVLQMNVRYNESAFVMQILLQFGRQNKCS